MAVRQLYTPAFPKGTTFVLIVGGQPITYSWRGWCLKLVDDAGNAPRRTANADAAYVVERNAGRIHATTPPVGIWVVGYFYIKGQPGHVVLMKHLGNGKYEIRDSEVQAGVRAPYTSIKSVEAWYSNYKCEYRGWSFQCDGRVYAENYTPTPTKDTLKQGEKLTAGQSLRSRNNTYRAVYQGDGNFVVYKGNKSLWSTKTNGKKSTRLILQGDGNLVIYNVNTPVWNSKTNGKGTKGAYRLIMQSDGNLVIYDKNNKAIWATYTNRK